MAKQEHTPPVAADPLAVGAAHVEDDDEIVDDGLVEVTNLSGTPQKFTIEGRKIKLPPKRTARIAPAYAQLRVGANAKGDPLPSVVALLTNFNVQATDKSHQCTSDGRPIVPRVQE